jgi:hypothetical protein
MKKYVLSLSSLFFFQGVLPPIDVFPTSQRRDVVYEFPSKSLEIRGCWFNVLEFVSNLLLLIALND